MFLDDIVANKRAEVAERRRRISLAERREQAESLEPARAFAKALDKNNVALIAEIKRASPSKGVLSTEVDPRRRAKVYAMLGAAAISVLTDEAYFHGTLDDLVSVRTAVDIPVLRKDFIVDEYQIYESRASRADALLLIVRALSDAQLGGFIALAESLGMTALVEIHDERELHRALSANASVIGINNRNLADFTVDLATTERIAPQIPAGRTLVAESGVSTRADVERAARAGADAVLVGEALMRAPNVEVVVQELSRVPRLSRAPVHLKPGLAK